MTSLEEKKKNAVAWQQHLDSKQPNRERELQESMGKIFLLLDEKEELEHRLDRQRTSLEIMASLIKATRDPLDTLPLELGDTDEDLENMTAQDAMVLTVTNLRDQIECMEEEREKLIKSFKNVRGQNNQLKMENQAQALKIAKLEELFTELNSGRQEPEPQPSEPVKKSSFRNIFRDMMFVRNSADLRLVKTYGCENKLDDETSRRRLRN